VSQKKHTFKKRECRGWESDQSQEHERKEVPNKQDVNKKTDRERGRERPTDKTRKGRGRKKNQRATAEHTKTITWEQTA